MIKTRTEQTIRVLFLIAILTIAALLFLHSGDTTTSFVNATTTTIRATSTTSPPVIIP